jgi:hypothetical protein
MQVVSNAPVRVASLLWQPSPGAFAITVLCKATYLLRPGECPLAPDQEALQKEDGHWEQDPLRSLRVASDLAPMKPRADVVLVGYAFAPGKTPARSLVARLAVADIDKSIEVFGPRFFDPDGVLREGQPFAQMPLVYERAAAGAENPAGIRGGARETQQKTELPNLQPPGLRITSPNDAVPPIGFGPIASTWPLRLEALGRHAAGWNHAKWYRNPLENDIDPAYFNFAPRDQRPEALREDERIVLENLHPDHPLFVTCLPGIRASASVEILGQAPFSLALRCDTLCIDTDRLLCTLVWRGHFPVENPKTDGRVVITMDIPTQRGPSPGAKDVYQETVVPAHPIHHTSPEQALPFPATGAAGRAPSSGLPGPGLPFAGSAPLPSGPTPVVSARSAPTMELAAYAPLPALADAPPVPMTIGQSVVAGTYAAPEGPPSAFGPRQPEMMAVTPAVDDSAMLAAQVAAGGALAASNAAVAPAAAPLVSPPPRADAARAQVVQRFDAHELLRLAWFDPESVPRIRRRPAFRAILDELDRRPPDPEFDNASLEESPAEIEDRREIVEILLRGVAVDAEGVRAAINDGIRDDGRFIPQVVLVATEIELMLDEIETLRAMLPTAASLAGSSDTTLKAAVDGAAAFLSAPGIPSPVVAEVLAERIRAAVAPIRKATKTDPLEAPTERLLLERRLYQRRAVLGDVYLRALTRFPGGAHAIPTYFPEAAAKKLPLYRRLKARLIAETHLPVDPAEPYPAALRALALAEVLPGGKR